MSDAHLLAIDCSGDDVNRLGAHFQFLSASQLEGQVIETEYLGILIGSEDPATVSRLLTLFRANPATCLIPIYVLRKHLANTELADGELPEDFLRRLEDYQRRRRRLAINPLESLENRLLSYLCKRPINPIPTSPVNPVQRP